MKKYVICFGSHEQPEPMEIGTFINKEDADAYLLSVYQRIGTLGVMSDYFIKEVSDETN